MLSWGSILKKVNGFFLMGRSGVTGTKLMPSLVGGDTETVCSKFKSWKGF